MHRDNEQTSHHVNITNANKRRDQIPNTTEVTIGLEESERARARVRKSERAREGNKKLVV